MGCFSKFSPLYYLERKRIAAFKNNFQLKINPPAWPGTGWFGQNAVFYNRKLKHLLVGWL